MNLILSRDNLQRLMQCIETTSPGNITSNATAFAQNINCKSPKTSTMSFPQLFKKQEDEHQL